MMRWERWERWADWQRGDPRWAVATLDNTHLNVAETASVVSAWLARQRRPAPASHPPTPAIPILPSGQILIRPLTRR